MSEPVKAMIAPEFPTPAIAQKAEAAVAAYRAIGAGFGPPDIILAEEDGSFLGACKRGDVDVVKALIAEGANVRAGHDEALKWAADSGHCQVVSLLIEHGADIHAENDEAVLRAARNGHCEMVRLLIGHGANIRVCDDLAVRMASEKGYCDVARLLIEHGADIRARSNEAVIKAAQNGHCEMMRLLIDHDADINDQYGDAIKLAARGGHTDAVRLLIEHEADIHVWNEEPLRLAAENGHYDTVRLLIESGAKVQAYNNRAVRKAAENGHREVFRLLIEHGANIRVIDDLTLRSTAQHGQCDMVRLLVEHGADIHAKNDDAIISAARQGHCDMVHLLIELGANIHAQNDAALRTSAEYGHCEMVRLLIGHGADIHAENGAAIRRAAENGHREIVRLLIESGTNIQARSIALILAAVWGHYDTVCLLIDHGADIHAQDNKAVKCAAQGYHCDVVSLLVDHGADAGDFPGLASKQRQVLTEYNVQTQRWRQVLRRDPLPYLRTEDPLLFKGACYESVRRMLAEEGCIGEVGAKMAFHTAALFQSEARVLQYLKQWGKPGTQPLHDLVHMISVPSLSPQGIKPNLKDWADSVLKCGPSMARLVKFADKLSSPMKTDDARTWSMIRTREECSRFGYTHAKENLSLATLCFEHGLDEKTFDDALAIVKRKQSANKNIPDMMFDGETFDMPGGKFRRLADGDIKGLFLGEMTDCCQSIGGAGAICAERGFTSENSGFYVVENAKGRIVGQSWVWRGEKGELCLDSLETLGNSVTGDQWLRLIAVFRTALSTREDHNVTALTVGTAGATNDSCPGLTGVFAVAANAVPLDYDGYRDSHTQKLIWRAPRV